MGYSIAIRCRNEKLRQKMFEFLKENYRDVSVVFNQKGHIPASRLDLSEHLSYDNSKSSVGFDYSCMCEQENQYVYCLLYWVALKVGKKRYFKKLEASVPYIVYDGYEAWPRLERGEWEKKVPVDFQWCLVDKYGFKSCKTPGRCEKYYRALRKLLGISVRQQDKIVRDELRRLDALWEAL